MKAEKGNYGKICIDCKDKSFESWLIDFKKNRSAEDNAISLACQLDFANMNYYKEVLRSTPKEMAEYVVRKIYFMEVLRNH